MRNDVSIPPGDSEFVEAPLMAGSSAKEVSAEAVPPPDGLKADVTLFDHPNLAPGGAGNFWLLGMIGLIIVGVAIVLFWMLHGLMK